MCTRYMYTYLYLQLYLHIYMLHTVPKTCMARRCIVVYRHLRAATCRNTVDRKKAHTEACRRARSLGVNPMPIFADSPHLSIFPPRGPPPPGTPGSTQTCDGLPKTRASGHTSAFMKSVLMKNPGSRKFPEVSVRKPEATHFMNTAYNDALNQPWRAGNTSPQGSALLYDPLRSFLPRAINVCSLRPRPMSQPLRGLALFCPSLFFHCDVSKPPGHYSKLFRVYRWSTLTSSLPAL